MMHGKCAGTIQARVARARASLPAAPELEHERTKAPTTSPAANPSTATRLIGGGFFTAGGARSANVVEINADERSVDR